MVGYWETRCLAAPLSPDSSSYLLQGTLPQCIKESSGIPELSPISLRESHCITQTNFKHPMPLPQVLSAGGQVNSKCMPPHPTRFTYISLQPSFLLIKIKKHTSEQN